jgi:hypothetical protein
MIRYRTFAMSVTYRLTKRHVSDISLVTAVKRKGGYRFHYLQTKQTNTTPFLFVLFGNIDTYTHNGMGNSPPPLPPPKKDTDLVRLPSIWFRFYDFIPDTTIGCYDVRDRSDPLPCTFTKKVTFLGSLYIVPHVTAWSAPLNGTIISTIWIAYTAAMFVLLILD